MKHSYRQKALENMIRRLDRRIESLHSVDRRYSWYRMGIVVLGVIIILISENILDAKWNWYALFFIIVAFSFVAYGHHMLDKAMEEFKIWKTIKLSQLARMTLDWERIPVSPREGDRKRKSLDIDLDLTGRRHYTDYSMSPYLEKAACFWRSGCQLLYPIQAVLKCVKRSSRI